MIMQSFIELLEYGFEKNKNKVAIIYHDKNITFGQLKQKAEKVGAFLQQKGFKKGDRVVLYTPEKLPFLIAHLGIILSGGISLPLNFNFTKDEMIYFLNDSEASFVFASNNQVKLIKEIKEMCPALKGIIDPDIAQIKFNEKFKEAEINKEDCCFILYSSGTTGQPKGVVHTHENIAKSLLSLKDCWKFNSEDILLNVLPLFHIHGLSFAAHLSLISGSTMILEDCFHPLKTMEKIKDAAVFMAVPTLYYAFLRRPEFKQKAKNWSKMRLFTCGSAPIRPEVLPEIETIIGKNLINRYGMTESHVITSLPLNGPFKQGSVGLPLDNIEMKLADENDKTILKNNTVGEVKIKSENLFSHYWKKPEETKKAFDKEGFFYTGDLGYLDKDGFLTLVGRKKDLIITNGYNVYPPIVERVLNKFPLVRESAVVGIPDEKRGEKVVAVIVPDDKINIQQLKKYCQQKLVDYQRPLQFEIIEELPRNTMGKVLKRTLKERITKGFKKPL
jgi:malonyl-CoA/methylmalonyl-CoA synthetase